MTRVIPNQTEAVYASVIDQLNEGVLALSTQGAFHYANRAALAMHEAGDLEALGRDAEGYRERFRLVDLDGVPLPSGGYPADRLLRGERFADLTVKLLLGEEEHVHVYTSVYPGEAAEPTSAGDAALLLIDDVTGRYDAEQRFERAFSSNPAPALIGRLSDLRFIKVDRSFLEMTGFKREEIVGRTAYEFDVFAGVTEREQVLKRFHDGVVISPRDSFLSTQDGARKYVIVGGQPLEVNDEPCMLLTFVDIDERKRMETALRQSEEGFAKAFDLAPVAAGLSLNEGGRFFDVNRAFRVLTGYGDEDVMGRTGADLGLWSHASERLMSGALEQRNGYRDLEVELRTKSGSVRTVQVSAETLLVDSQARVLRMFHDVTEWKRTEADLVEAINEVMADPNWFSASVAERVRHARGGASSEAKAKLTQLTGRERQVFALCARGLSNDAVAEELEVAKNTVRNYVAGLYRKLGVHSRAELIVWARRNGVT